MTSADVSWPLTAHRCGSPVTAPLEHVPGMPPPFTLPPSYCPSKSAYCSYCHSYFLIDVPSFTHRGLAWIASEAFRANDVHPLVECSNKGICDREHGDCACFRGYEGVACERSSCPNECSGRGICYTLKQFADEAGRVYRAPWDANKITG
jgi:hypothetical protein